VRRRCQAAKAPISRDLPFFLGSVISFSLRAEEAAGDLLLVGLDLESDELAEIDEVSKLLLAFRLDSGHSEQPLGGRGHGQGAELETARAHRATRWPTAGAVVKASGRRKLRGHDGGGPPPAGGRSAL
jgi:hypothetical protein